MSDNIKVAVRVRGLIEREINENLDVHWKVKDPCTVCPSNTSSGTSYAFDRVFDCFHSNEDIYSEFCSPIIKSVINGFNGTIFAYGQTSSGKTYTIMGDDENPGIAHYTISGLFEQIQKMPNREFLLRVSYLEIYNEYVNDLLAVSSGQNLKLQEDQYGTIKVNNLTEIYIQEPEQILKLMKKAQKQRKTGDTYMNNKSSRSHSIFRMIVESGLRDVENGPVNVSQFNLVDLAGSEKVSRNIVNGKRFKEGVNINMSLLTLSKVISQLSCQKEDQFINYRESKLTRILQNSLGGNALTAIICTITPASLDETLSTLKFALRAKEIKNKPKVNEVQTEQALLKKYANDLKKLSKELEATKEEKYQETQICRNLRLQIENLKKNFVSHSIRPEISRAARRETWGGCMDAARLILFPPRRTIPLPTIEDTSAQFTSFASIQRRSTRDEDLPILEEESEMDLSAPETEKVDADQLKTRKSTLTSAANSYYSNCLTKAVAVQTDVSTLETSVATPGMENEFKVRKLEKELLELREFTKLERLCEHYTQKVNPLDLDSPDVINVSHTKSPYSPKHPTFFTETCSTKESQTSFTEKLDSIQTNSPLKASTSSYDCKQQISSLEEEIKIHLKEISDLQKECESKQKQVSLSKDKISIQDQIIQSLKNEIALKEETLQQLETINDARKFCSMENSTQTYLHSDYDHCSITSKLDESDLSNELESHVEEHLNSQCQISTWKPIWTELFCLKKLTIQIAGSNIPKTYLGDVNVSLSEEPEIISWDMIEKEVNILKALLGRIEFYLKDRAESSAYFNGVLEAQMDKNSSLERQLSSLTNALGTLKNVADIIKEKLALDCANTQFNSPVLENSPIARYLNDIDYLQCVIQNLEKSIEDKECKIANFESLQKIQNLKESKLTQTVENLIDLADTEKKIADVCKAKEDLLFENLSLKKKDEQLSNEIENLALALKQLKKKAIEDEEMYQKKLDNAIASHEKISKVEMQNYIKDLEEKYELELNNQEKEFFDSLEQFKATESKKMLSYTEQLDISYKEQLSKLNEEHKVVVSDFQKQFSEEMSKSSAENFKLREEILALKNREDHVTKKFHHLKNKFMDYMRKVELTKMNEVKSFKDKYTLTDMEEIQNCNGCTLLKKQVFKLQNKVTSLINMKPAEESCKSLKHDLDLKNSKIKSLESDISALTRELASKTHLLQTCNCRMIANAKEMCEEMINSVKTKQLESSKDMPQLREKISDDDILKLDIVKDAIQSARQEELAIFEKGMGPASDVKCLFLQRKLYKKEKEVKELQALISKKSVISSEQNLFAEHKLKSESKCPTAPKLKCESEQFSENQDPSTLKNPPFKIHPIELETEKNYTAHFNSDPFFLGTGVIPKIKPKRVLQEKNRLYTDKKTDPVEPVNLISDEEAKKIEYARQFRFLTGEDYDEYLKFNLKP